MYTYIYIVSQNMWRIFVGSVLDIEIMKKISLQKLNCGNSRLSFFCKLQTILFHSRNILVW